MTNKEYNDLMDRTDSIESDVVNILNELRHTERYENVKKIYGRSIAEDKLYAAERHLKEMVRSIKLEIRNQIEGML